MLFYVRLLNRDQTTSSPQKHSRRSDEATQVSNQKDLATKAHQTTVEHLRHVASHYALERRLFY